MSLSWKVFVSLLDQLKVVYINCKYFPLVDQSVIKILDFNPTVQEG